MQINFLSRYLAWSKHGKRYLPVAMGTCYHAYMYKRMYVDMFGLFLFDAYFVSIGLWFLKKKWVSDRRSTDKTRIPSTTLPFHNVEKNVKSREAIF